MLKQAQMNLLFHHMFLYERTAPYSTHWYRYEHIREWLAHIILSWNNICIFTKHHFHYILAIPLYLHLPSFYGLYFFSISLFLLLDITWLVCMLLFRFMVVFILCITERRVSMPVLINDMSWILLNHHVRFYYATLWICK